MQTRLTWLRIGPAAREEVGQQKRDIGLPLLAIQPKRAMVLPAWCYDDQPPRVSGKDWQEKESGAPNIFTEEIQLGLRAGVARPWP